jgi:hypothetical protein
VDVDGADCRHAWHQQARGDYLARVETLADPHPARREQTVDRVGEGHHDLCADGSWIRSSRVDLDLDAQPYGDWTCELNGDRSIRIDSTVERVLNPMPNSCAPW